MHKLDTLIMNLIYINNKVINIKIILIIIMYETLKII